MFVLMVFWLVNAGGGGAYSFQQSYGVAMQEFSTKATCDYAATAAKSGASGKVVTAFCVPK